MLKLHIERIGDVAVIQCAGTIVQSDATLKLRDAVRQQRDARVILLDLSDVDSLGSSGLGMLLFLERWAGERGVQFQIFDPPDRVLQSLERARSTVPVENAGMVEVLSQLGWYEHGLTSEVGYDHGMTRDLWLADLLKRRCTIGRLALRFAKALPLRVPAARRDSLKCPRGGHFSLSPAC